MGCVTSTPCSANDVPSTPIQPPPLNHRRSASGSKLGSPRHHVYDDPRAFHPPPRSQTVRYRRNRHHRSMTDSGRGSYSNSKEKESTHHDDPTAPNVICNLQIYANGTKYSLPIPIFDESREHLDNIPSRNRTSTGSYALEWSQRMHRQTRVTHLQRQAVKKSGQWKRRASRQSESQQAEDGDETDTKTQAKRTQSNIL